MLSAFIFGLVVSSALVIGAIARGAVLASLADTLMPDAYREDGKWVAFATATGFLLSFLIAEV